MRKTGSASGDMTQYGGSIVQGSAGVRIGAPTRRGLFGVPRRSDVRPSGQSSLGAKVLPVKPTSPCPARCRSSLPHLQQLLDKTPAPVGEPRPWLENACGYPLTAAR